MDAEFTSKKRGQQVIVQLKGLIPPHIAIPASTGESLAAVTTSVFVHFHYKRVRADEGRYRDLSSMHVLLLPHQSLKSRYNPDSRTTFFGEGKHSPGRGEAQRIRVYFARLRHMCPWRIQELAYRQDEAYTRPMWRDVLEDGSESEKLFRFIGRWAPVPRPLADAR